MTTTPQLESKLPPPPRLLLPLEIDTTNSSTIVDDDNNNDYYTNNNEYNSRRHGQDHHHHHKSNINSSSSTYNNNTSEQIIFVDDDHDDIYYDDNDDDDDDDQYDDSHPLNYHPSQRRQQLSDQSTIATTITPTTTFTPINCCCRCISAIRIQRRRIQNITMKTIVPFLIVLYIYDKNKHLNNSTNNNDTKYTGTVPITTTKNANQYNNNNNSNKNNNIHHYINYCIDEIEEEENDINHHYRHHYRHGRTVVSSNHNENDNNNNLCKCMDPTIPTIREHDNQWTKHHETMVQDVQYYTSRMKVPKSNTTTLDFVLIGDSITERWNGTKGIGSIHVPEYRAVFDRYFGGGGGVNNDDNKNTKVLYGMAFGSSGDISTELLWHLQNGIVMEQVVAAKEKEKATTATTTIKTKRTLFEPKVWVVLIGTNDLGRMNCSKHTVLRGIVNVVNYIANSTDSTTAADMATTTTPTLPPPILVHGLLPRSDYYGLPRNYTLGSMYYNQIVWINEQLQALYDSSTNRQTRSTSSATAAGGTNNDNKNASNKKLRRFYYLNVNDLFLTNSKTDSDEEIINPLLMEDALHPTVQGYEQWGPVLVQTIQQILNETYGMN